MRERISNVNLKKNYFDCLDRTTVPTSFLFGASEMATSENETVAHLHVRQAERHVSFDTEMRGTPARLPGQGGKQK